MTLTAASPVDTGSYRFVRLGDAVSNGLKIRSSYEGAGSNPAPGTSHFNNLQTLIILV